MSKTGILGGTFNPIHNGHIQLGEYCKNELGLDRVILIPTFVPPHKVSANLANEAHRLNMCRLACENHSGFEVSDIEIKRGGKSYSYQTLTSLKELYPHDDFYFIMGADMFLSLHLWKNPKIIFSLATMTAIPRNKSDYEDLQKYFDTVIKPMGANARILKKSVMNVSSTFIRENIDNADLVAPLIDRNVYEYIVKNKLYRM